MRVFFSNRDQLLIVVVGLFAMLMSCIRLNFRGLLFLVFVLTIFSHLRAHLKSVRIKEIPFDFAKSVNDKTVASSSSQHKGIIADARHDERKYFFHLFNIKYIVCFFAAKGKWPFIPSFMQGKVDTIGRSIFSQNDSFIQNYCKNWIPVKLCHRPNYVDTERQVINAQQLSNVETCNCGKKTIEEISPVVYFDKNYIGNVSSETILNTIEFLQSFLPLPTKKPKKKNRVRNNGFIQILN